jgi:hypothetical protein
VQCAVLITWDVFHYLHQVLRLPGGRRHVVVIDVDIDLRFKDGRALNPS